MDKEVFVFPASFAQQRLWFLDQLEPGTSAYTISAALGLTGPLNVAALAQSLNEIIRRHEALRTTFSVREGQPMQVITPTLSLPLLVMDLQALPETQREAEVGRLATAEAHKPFDLARGPLLRFTLLRLGDEDHVLLLTMHHIVSDGWSMGVLYRELSVLYQAFTHAHPSPLPDLPIQYADFAVWQRQWLQGEILGSQLSYWKKQLAGLPVLELPTDRPRPAVQSFRGASQSIELSKELTAGLKALSRKQEVTLFITLLAGFQTLLHRYAGQDDIVVGSPIANRNRAEIESLIGFFVNTLVLRTNLSGNPTFTELLTRVREMALGAYAHQDLPFEKLVEELRPERDLSHHPLFQVMFVLDSAPLENLELSGLTLNPLEKESGTAKFDLTLSMTEGADGLIGALEYNTDLFEAATITRMVGHWQVLLESLVANPAQRLTDLPLLTEAERRQLLVAWNGTTTDYPRDQCLHQLFEAQVEQTPGAVAVVCEDAQLTYRELNHRANQLAHYLQSLGVGPEVLVGLCVERSVEMVIGLLGILKAGGAYVPLDPAYPRERLAFMLEDAEVRVLLTQERLIPRLPEQKAQVVCLDTGWEASAPENKENPVSRATADNVAYVLYTSGSTGQPKGVMIEHRSLVSYLGWVNDSLLGDTVQHLPLATKLSFDACLKQLFAPLLRGREVWILSEEVLAQPAALLSALGTRTKVGLNCVPSLWKALLDAIPSGQALLPTDSLTCLLVGGEHLGKELVSSSFSTLPHLQIWNLYGPTETTANASVARIVSEDEVTIGRPIANTQVYILDQYLQPVPIGVPGELHIGGTGLARGYLNRPRLTAEKFIPHLFSAQPGARLYKTGDLARYLPDGNIEFLGRTDHQVKIRGFRIELGEIEAALDHHPAVRETVVTTREDAHGDKRLVAYVVPKQEPTPTVSALRSFLKEQLPEYMVPSVFVVIEALPLTPNGKVDRGALPAPEGGWPELAGVFVAPSTPVEEALADIWGQVLELEQVGIHDNFFELGGVWLPS